MRTIIIICVVLFYSCSFIENKKEENSTSIMKFDIDKWKNCCIDKINNMVIKPEDTSFFNQIKPYFLNLINTVDTAVVQKNIETFSSISEQGKDSIAFLYYVNDGEVFSEYYSFFVKKTDKYYSKQYAACGSNKKAAENKLDSLDDFYFLINNPNQGTKYYSRHLAVLTTIGDEEMNCHLVVSPSNMDYDRLNRLILQCSE